MTVSPIYALTQFTGGTGVVWRGLTQPVPDGVLTIESDTGIVKRGDGVTLYPQLPVFFNALYLQDVANSVELAQAQAVAAAQSAAAAVAASQRAQAGSLLSAHTSDLTPTPLTGLGALPSGIATQAIFGMLTALNTTTGDVACWNILVSVGRKTLGADPVLLGSPDGGEYYNDPSMSGCTIAFSTNNLGLVITVTGLASTNIAWGGSMIVAAAP